MSFAAYAALVTPAARSAQPESEAFVGELVQAFGEQIAVGIDAKDGQVAVKGWVATAELSALALARRMAALGVRTLIHTDIGTDGMLTGPNYAAQKAMLAAGSFNVIARLYQIGAGGGYVPCLNRAGRGQDREPDFSSYCWW